MAESEIAAQPLDPRAWQNDAHFAGLVKYFGVQNWQRLVSENYDGEDVRPLIKALLDSPDDVFLTNLQIAIRLSMPTLSNLDATRNEVYKRAREAVMEYGWSSDEVAREQVAQALWMTGVAENRAMIQEKVDSPRFAADQVLLKAITPLLPPAEITRLLTTLNDPTFEESSYIIRQVVLPHATPEHTPLLLEILGNPALDHRWRLYYIEKLVEFGDKSVAIPLVKLYKLLSEYILNRIGVEKALRTLANPAIVPDLLDWLVSPELELDAKLGLVSVLAEVGGVAALDTAQEHVPTGESKFHKQLAVYREIELAPNKLDKIYRFFGEPITEYVPPDKRPPNLDEAALVTALLTMLRDPAFDKDTKYLIPDKLAETGASYAIPDLLYLLSASHLDSFVKEHIADACGNFGDPTYAPQIADALTTPKLSVEARIYLLRGLGKLKNPQVVPALVQILKKPRIVAELGEEIMKALVAIGDTTAGAELVEFVLSLRGSSNLGWQINPYVVHLIPDGGLLETYLRGLDKKAFHYSGRSMPLLADVTRRLGVRVYKERYNKDYEVRAVS